MRSSQLVGAIGLLKFNDGMTRLHAPTKVGTVGVGALLLASMIHSYTYGEGSMHELLIMAFLFVTAPISANFIGKVHIHKNTCETPPPPARGQHMVHARRARGRPRAHKPDRGRTGLIARPGPR